MRYIKDSEYEHHTVLFDGTPLIVGKIHRLFTQSENLFKNEPIVDQDIYQWWITQFTIDRHKMLLKIKTIVENLTIFKESFRIVPVTKLPLEYETIINSLKEIFESNSHIIQSLFEFLTELSFYDKRAVYMLYTPNLWNEDRNDQVSRCHANIPMEDLEYLSYCVEFALGLCSGLHIYTLDAETWDVQARYYESINPDTFSDYPSELGEQYLQAAYKKIWYRVELYFTNLLTGLTNITKVLNPHITN